MKIKGEPKSKAATKEPGSQADAPAKPAPAKRKANPWIPAIAAAIILALGLTLGLVLWFSHGGKHEQALLALTRMHESSEAAHRELSALLVEANALMQEMSEKGVAIGGLGHAISQSKGQLDSCGHAIGDSRPIVQSEGEEVSLDDINAALKAHEESCQPLVALIDQLRAAKRDAQQKLGAARRRPAPAPGDGDDEEEEEIPREGYSVSVYPNDSGYKFTGELPQRGSSGTCQYYAMGGYQARFTPSMGLVKFDGGSGQCQTGDYAPTVDSSCASVWIECR